MKYYQTFSVKSRYQFPIDMLRYDGCFPASQIASAKITESLSACGGPVEVVLGRYVDRKGDTPTVDRWKSFSCEVSDVEVR